MPYDLSQIDRDGVIRLLFSGKPDLREHEEARSAAAELCETMGCWRLIVDMTKLESIKSCSTVDLFEFGRQFSMGQFPPKTKIAVVSEDSRKPELGFVVTVARNRGFFMKIFNDVDEAQRWLQQ